MKKALVIMLLLVAVLPVLAQDKDTTLSWQNYYSDSLKTAPRDTVQVSWKSEAVRWEGYQINVRSSAADTIVVETRDEVGNWSVAGVVSSVDATGAVAVQIITTTLNVKWYINDLVAYGIRVRANAVLGTQTTYFTVTGIPKD